MAKNRLIGGYPVIGIRPTIDGRRGPLKVREGLEEQTMGMARAAAKLFTENLRYANGEAVKVVIADTTIGRVSEAAACEEKFRREGVAITLTVTPCWCDGSETMDMDPTTIKGVWGLNATERPGKPRKNCSPLHASVILRCFITERCSPLNEKKRRSFLRSWLTEMAQG